MVEQMHFFDVGNEPITITFKSKYQKWKFEHNYSKADEYSDIRCANCIYCFKTQPSERAYYKCEKLGMSASSATDIRLSNVCDLFEMIVKEDNNNE